MSAGRHMVTKRSFGLVVTQLREQKRWTKVQLAEAVDVSTTCVWNWEQGNTFPRGEALDKLAEALGTSREFLRYGTAHPGTDSNDSASLNATPASLAEIIEDARVRIANAAELPPDRVRVVLDYGG